MSKIQETLAKMQKNAKLPYQIWMIRYDLGNRMRSRKGFGLNEVIGIAAGLLIAGVVIIPGLLGLAGTILGNIETWWSSFSGEIFITNSP